LHLRAVFLILWSCGTVDHSALPLAPPSFPPLRAIERPLVNDLSSRVARITREIAALRGWDGGIRIPYEWAARGRIREAVLADLHAQMAPSELRGQTQFLEALGWAPPSFSLEDALSKDFAREIVGLYVLSWQRILLATNHHASSLDAVLRHELVHAFQDHYFQIGRRVRWVPNHGDEIAAIHALAEGEAICIARELEDHRGCSLPTAKPFEDHLFDANLEGIPSAIRYSLIAPYVDGVHYVRRLLQQGGWPRVDEAWRSKLRATRELFRDEPESVELVDTPPAVLGFGDCQQLYSDPLGEQGLASILFGEVGPEAARKMAGSLESDRAVYWRCQHGCSAAWHLRFLTNEAAFNVALILHRSTDVQTRGDEASCPGFACRQTPARLNRYLRDIVITSVHKCDHSDFEFAPRFGESERDWSRRIFGHSAAFL